jgi:hypothetical protein
MFIVSINILIIMQESTQKPATQVKIISDRTSPGNYAIATPLLTRTPKMIVNQLGTYSFSGGCCRLLCFNDAVYYDASGKGYCLNHAPKHLIDSDEE